MKRGIDIWVETVDSNGATIGKREPTAEELRKVVDIIEKGLDWAAEEFNESLIVEETWELQSHIAFDLEAI